jgi:hypothetical protein
MRYAGSGLIRRTRIIRVAPTIGEPAALAELVSVRHVDPHPVDDERPLVIRRPVLVTGGCHCFGPSGVFVLGTLPPGGSRRAPIAPSFVP